MPDPANVDARVLSERLRVWVMQPHVREALWLASPSLYDAVEAWLRDPLSPRAHGVGDALVRYFVRMATRCTPFGLFSGCSTGVIADETRLELAGVEQYRRHTRLDTHFLTSLIDAMLGQEELRHSVRLFPNSSLVDLGERLRYIESRLDGATRRRSFRLMAVRSTPYLRATLERARGGATLERLARALVAPDVSESEAYAYVEQLIDAQLLESELSARVTGDEPLDELVRWSRAQLPGADVTERVSIVARELAALDLEPLGSSRGSYARVQQTLAALPAPVDPARLFQVDLYKPAPGLALGTSVVDEIAAAVALLARITPAEPSHELQRFREAFEARYELAEVPLLEALDEERGIGFPRAGDLSGDTAPLLANVQLPEPDAEVVTRYPVRDERLVAAACECLRRERTEWVLSSADIRALELATPTPPPDAFAALATLAAPGRAALERGEFSLHLRGIVGPSGATLFGRFCHGDAALAEAVRNHLEQEERLRPGAIFAEIVHLPEGRMGNVLCRPVLRGHEIPYLGRSGAPAEQQIAVQDLTVSLRGERIVLRSRSRDREIIPRLTSAHDYAGAELGVYRFLCRMQEPRPLAWAWGSVASTLPFLPRVRAGRSVLALARWRLARADLEPIVAAAAGAARARVADLRERLGLPRHVCLVEDDQLLWIDWENPLCVQSFLSLIKSAPFITLVEAFPSGKEAVVFGPEGRFAHELVVPFVRSTTQQPERVPQPARPARCPAPALRQFVPGSEWLYAKIYAGDMTCDQILRELVAPLKDELLAERLADGWFFIRYRDPEPHLRVRFHGEPQNLVASVVPRLEGALRPWLCDGRVLKLQLDTYTRELERYGGAAGIELAERLFHVDSDAALALCQLTAADVASDTRLMLALYGCHRLLADLALPLAERQRLSALRRRALALEYRADPASARQLGAAYRRLRPSIEKLLAREQPELAAAHAAFDRRSRELGPIAAELRERAQNGLLSQSLGQLGASFLHLSVNRLLSSEQRFQEWAVCDFLERVYESEGARQKLRSVDGRPRTLQEKVRGRL